MTKEKLKRAKELEEKIDNVEYALGSLLSIGGDSKVIIGIKDDYGDIDVIIDDHKLVNELTKGILRDKLDELRLEFQNL